MDHERCLRIAESLQCLQEHNMHALANYSKCSPDLHSMENAWAHLRARLDETAPCTTETRKEFIVRLRAAAQYLEACPQRENGVETVETIVETIVFCVETVETIRKEES